MIKGNVRKIKKYYIFVIINKSEECFGGLRIFKLQQKVKNFDVNYDIKLNFLFYCVLHANVTACAYTEPC